MQTIPPSRQSRDTSASLRYAQPSVRTGPPLHKGGFGVSRLRARRGDAPQGYLFRFAPLRGHRPLRKVYRGCGRATSLPPSKPSVLTPPSQREAKVSAPAGAGNGFPRQSADWLGMTPLRGVWADRVVRPYGGVRAAAVNQRGGCARRTGGGRCRSRWGRGPPPRPPWPGQRRT